MSEKFTQEKVIADPSISSLREETLDLELKGIEKKFSIDRAGQREIEVYIDRETGEKFYKIYPLSAPYQKMMALMLKGIINVSDVVKVENDYYSHIQNFDYLASSEENIVAQMEADLFIIKEIFEDYDHTYYSEDNSLRTETDKKNMGASVLEHHNLIIDEANKKLNFFDFGNVWFLWQNISPENLSDLEINFQEAFREAEFDSNPNKNMIIEILKRKIKILAELYSDDEFERFKKMVQKSEIELDAEKQRIIFNNIKLRLQALNKTLAEIK